MSEPLTLEALRLIDAYWRAANYLSVGQIFLYDNPLLKRPLGREHIKPRLLGHWGTTPGLNFIYVHLNRVIKARDLDMIYITGPGHGGPGIVANTYLEGTYSKLYPNISQDEEETKNSPRRRRERRVRKKFLNKILRGLCASAVSLPKICASRADVHLQEYEVHEDRRKNLSKAPNFV